MEQTAAILGSTPFWYQLYWSTDEALVDSMIKRAQGCGAQALVVTLDTTILGWRPQDLNLGSLPFARGQGIAQYTSDPRFLDIVQGRMSAAVERAGTRVTLGAVRTLIAMSREYPGPLRNNVRSLEPRAAVEAFSQIYSNPGLSWEHIATLRDRTSLPVVLKGNPPSRWCSVGSRAGRRRADRVEPWRQAGRQCDRHSRCIGRRSGGRRRAADDLVGQRYSLRNRCAHRVGARGRCLPDRPAIHLRAGPRWCGCGAPGHREHCCRARLDHGAARRPDYQGSVPRRPGASSVMISWLEAAAMNSLQEREDLLSGDQRLRRAVEAG
jgi:hypothetical protein